MSHSVIVHSATRAGGPLLPNEPGPDQPSDDGRVQRIVERAGTPLAVLTFLDTTPDTVRLLVEVVER